MLSFCDDVPYVAVVHQLSMMAPIAGRAVYALAKLRRKQSVDFEGLIMVCSGLVCN